MSTGQPTHAISNRALWSFRIAGLVAAALIAFIPFLIPSETAIDPLWQRFSLAGLITAISIGSIFSPFLKRNTYYFVYAYSFLINIWLIELAFLNDLILGFSPTPLICLLLTGILFKHFRLLLYFLSGIFIFSLCLYPIPDKPFFDPMFFYMIELMLMATIGFLMERQIRERGDMRREEGMQRLFAQAALELSDDGIMINDPEGVIMQYNRNFLDIWNLTEEDMDSSKPRAGIDKALAQLEDPEIYNQLSLKAFKDPELKVHQMVKMKDGRYFVRISKPLSYNGDHVGRIWFFRDLTSNQREKENLALLKSVFETSGLGILVTTRQGVAIDYNQNYLDMWGLTPEILKSPEAAIAHTRRQIQDQGYAATAINYLLQNPDKDREDLFWLKDGRFIERATRVIRVDEAINGRIWFYRDVTQRMQDERALKESEQQYKAIVNAVPDLMFRLDRSGNIIDLKVPQSGAFCEIDPAAIANLQDLFPEVLAKEVIALVQELLFDDASKETESQIDFSGKVRDLEIRLEKSASEEALAIIRDVTERKTTERELIQRNFELDSFVYRSSHDLKAPLNSLMGLINIIRDVGASEEMMTYINLMDRSVNKLDTFIRNLTDFSRINRLGVTGTEVDFKALLEETVEGLGYMEHADRIEKRIGVEGSGTFKGDEFHIGIVMSNLISNAIKYQDHSKKVSFVNVEVTYGPERAEIVVSDNGIGIPKKHQDRMFELFFRASNQSFGSGLGLYITKNAIEKLEGSISFKSSPESGTEFRVTLPNQISKSSPQVPA